MNDEKIIDSEMIRKNCTPSEIETARRIIGKARASGYLAGQRSKTAYKLGKQDGQAELAEKIANLIWAHPSYAGTQEDAEELVKDAMKLLASESFGNVVASRKPETKVKPKTAKPEPAIIVKGNDTIGNNL